MISDLLKWIYECMRVKRKQMRSSTKAFVCIVDGATIPSAVSSTSTTWYYMKRCWRYIVMLIGGEDSNISWRFENFEIYICIFCKPIYLWYYWRWIFKFWNNICWKDGWELELLEMKEVQLLQMQHKFTSIIEFWKLVPESKYPHLKKAA